MLCDVKMLLVFEDLNGELIRYSTHGIYDPEEYFKDAWHHTERSFTSKDVISKFFSPSSPLATSNVVP